MVFIELIHEDERGSIHRILSQGKEYLILFTRRGYARGGDHHKTIQHGVVISGQVEYRWKWLGGGETIKTLGPGEHISFPAGAPHLMTSITDSLVVEWLEGGVFEKTYYEPYRKLVRETYP